MSGCETLVSPMFITLLIVAGFLCGVQVTLLWRAWRELRELEQRP